MILTITMNPSIDISYQAAEFHLNTVNRVSSVRKTAGGKGLNVTRVLKQLGVEAIASGITGGVLGTEIKNILEQNGIIHDFLSIKGETRNCIAILHDGQQTEILESGPVISEKEAADFKKHLEKLVPKEDMIIFSGSLPEGLPIDFYSQMLQICQKKPVVLDCSGEALVEVLKGETKPFLIKPNMEEFAELSEQPVTMDVKKLKAALSDQLFAGIDWIVVSMGSEGAFAKHLDRFYHVTIPEITIANPVGSGDAMLAGLVAAIEKQIPDDEVLEQGSTLGMLNAKEETTGYVDLADYHTLAEQIQIEEV
ncbi:MULTISPECIES: tagatose-6-phosphate kinase [unclassified Enterococcus]|uniref:tagatose-6-phosphate kinase n=1 Tax=unclassified Enterococcus TaxID=2608891 RepID=UPI0013EAFC82|nr:MULTISPECIES: tagatose-6-phosphate kinase [unclassified Enterococcus]